MRSTLMLAALVPLLSACSKAPEGDEGENTVGETVVDASPGDPLEQVKTDLLELEGAVLAFMMENGGMHPEVLDDLLKPNANNVPYLKSLKKDPWGNDYIYEPPLGAKRIRVFTTGADGELGGAGLDADYDNRMARQTRTLDPGDSEALRPLDPPAVKPPTDSANPLSDDDTEEE